jgi:dTDP-4-dehydrorhamnose reductase
MRVVVTGAAGLLGNAVVRAAREREHDVCALDREALDVTDPGAVELRIRKEKPEVIVHCAAYTAVDGAEEEPDKAMRVNCDGTRNVALAAAQIGATVFNPSSDFVFDGRSERPYRPDDQPMPINAYGVSKLAGEQVLVLSGCDWAVVRTSWLYGSGGRDFVDVILDAQGKSDGMAIVDDQVGCPTWTGSLAPGIITLAEAGVRGTYHLCDGGSATWFQLASAVVEEASIDVEFTPTTAQEWGAPAPRPPYSVLDCSESERILGHPMPAWRASLVTYLSETL